MRGRNMALGGMAIASLACGGLFVDAAGVKQLEAALPMASASVRLPMFYQGSAEAGLVNPLCAERLEKVGRASAEVRSMFMAKILFEEPTCPRACADGDALAPLDPIARTDAAVTMCGGDDPFGGDLAPLRDRADALDYLMARLLFERATAQSPGFGELADELAVSLALGGPLRVKPSGSLQVDGTRDVPGLTAQALAGSLATCGAPVLEHRVVIGPDGLVVGVAGVDCGRKALEAMRFEGDGTWTVVDLGWEQPVH